MARRICESTTENGAFHFVSRWPHTHRTLNTCSSIGKQSLISGEFAKNKVLVSSTLKLLNQQVVGCGQWIVLVVLNLSGQLSDVFKLLVLRVLFDFLLNLR